MFLLSINILSMFSSFLLPRVIAVVIVLFSFFLLISYRALNEYFNVLGSSVVTGIRRGS